MRNDTGRGWRQWSIDEATAALAEQARSGKSDAAFAREAGCSTQRLRYWRRRVAELARVEFAEVEMPASSVVPAATVEIAIGAVVLRVRDLDEGAVARLILSLAGQRPC